MAESTIPSNELSSATDVKNDTSGEIKTYKPLPSLFRRALKISPMIELMGLLKDHRKHFKEHWIAACTLSKDGGEILKNGLTFMFEMELLVAVLLFGVTTSIYFQGITKGKYCNNTLYT